MLTKSGSPLPELGQWSPFPRIHGTLSLCVIRKINAFSGVSVSLNGGIARSSLTGTLGTRNLRPLLSCAPAAGQLQLKPSTLNEMMKRLGIHAKSNAMLEDEVAVGE
jgi:hypothetical protein